LISKRSIRSLLTLSSLFCAFTLASPAEAAKVQASVVIDKVKTLDCLDSRPFPLGCGEADYYAKMSFVSATGQIFNCDRTGTISDDDEITPGWACNFGGNPAHPILDVPATLIVEIWDDDSFLRDDDDLADIAPGAARALHVDLTPGVHSITSQGGDSRVELRVFVDELVDPPPVLQIQAEHYPLIPVTGDTVKITANAMDGDHCARDVGRIEIWVANDAEYRSRTEPAAPAFTCDGEDECEFSPAGLTDARGFFAYRAAYIEGDRRVETPWRVAFVADAEELANPPAGAYPIGVVSSPFGVARTDRNLDISFHRGSGFDLGDDAGRTAFSDTLRTHIRTLWGLGAGACKSKSSSSRMPSSVLDHQEQVSFWLSPRLVNVKKEQGGLGLCEWSLRPVRFAEVNGVVHTTSCRDNAPGGSFSSKSGSVSWHELHHAAYGLADEYCCDGGYFQEEPFPNLYDDLDDCQEDPLSGGACAKLSKTLPNGTVETKDWFRFDRTPDVMINNSVENPEEFRRADWYFGELARQDERGLQAKAAAALDPLAPGEEKSLALRLRVTASGATVVGADVEYSPARSYAGDPDQFRVQLVAFDGRVLREIQMWDPRGRRIYGDVDGEESLEIQPVAEVEIVIPFLPELKSVRFTDPSGQVLGGGEVVQAVGEFCELNPRDAECQEWSELGEADLSVRLDASPSPVVTGSEVVFTATVENHGPAASGATVTIDLPASVRVTSCSVPGGVCEGEGNRRAVTFGSLAKGASTQVQIAAVVDCALAEGTVILGKAVVTTSNPPPVIACPADVTVANDAGLCSAGVAPGFATATDNCAGPAVTWARADGLPLDAPYPVGTTLVTWTATDSGGATATCTQRVVVEDKEAPAILGARTDKTSLWPANHKLVDVLVGYEVKSNCADDQAASSLSVTSDEPVDGTGDGDAAPDWQVLDEYNVRLRAERSGNGDGRVYTVTITARDRHGNTSKQPVTVTVPKNRR
jgi:hypothetical protein